MTIPMPVATKGYTAEDVVALPGRWELVRGEVREMSPPGGEHGVVGADFAFLLTGHVKQHRLGRVFAAETGFLVARNPDTIRGADIAFVAAARVPDPIPSGWMTVVPDLAVEIVSPGDRAAEIAEKVNDWLGGGVRLVWVVYTRQRTVHGFRAGGDRLVLTAADVLDGEDVVPGFSVTVRDIFG
jgi:Uma2 family endonuclease